MFRSLGMHKIDPALSELITDLLHRSGKSVSIMPIGKLNSDFLVSLLERTYHPGLPRPTLSSGHVLQDQASLFSLWNERHRNQLGTES